MAEAPVVEKMARQAKKICDVPDNQRDLVVMMEYSEEDAPTMIPISRFGNQSIRRRPDRGRRRR